MAPVTASDRGLYIHVPFCKRRCVYCDFAVVTGRENQVSDYARALTREIELTASSLGRPKLDTIYFGGGTPSKTPDVVVAALDAAGRAFDVATDAEITVEANPESATDVVLDTFRAAGVTRLSVGVQSFDDVVLKRLGRLHDSSGAKRAVAAARERFSSVSLDLIFGIPEVSVESWRADLHQAAALGVDHLSPYCLTVEPGTPLAEEIVRGKAPPPDDDVEADHLEVACEALPSIGFERYEISSWAKPGKRCRHNTVYWRRDPCHAAGLGASGFWDGVRWTNVRGFSEYLIRIAATEPPMPFPPGPAADGVECLPPTAALGEAMLLGLRMTDGVDLSSLASRFGRDPSAIFADSLLAFEEEGLLERDGDRARLSNDGLRFSNRVFRAFTGPPQGE